MVLLFVFKIRCKGTKKFLYMQEKSKIFLFCHLNQQIRLIFGHFGDSSFRAAFRYAYPTPVPASALPAYKTDQSHTAGSLLSAGHCSHEYIRTSYIVEFLRQRYYFFFIFEHFLLNFRQKTQNKTFFICTIQKNVVLLSDFCVLIQNKIR